MTSLLAISRKRPVRKAVVAFLGGAFLLLLTLLRPVDELVRKADRSLWDTIIQLSGGPPERKDLVLLGIDDASLSASDLDPEFVANDPILAKMAGRFPWDRSVWAAAIDRLADAGARLIVVDLLLSEESTPQADEDLAAAIARHRDKVVLASVFGPAGSKAGDENQFSLMEPLPKFFGPGPLDTRCGYANFQPDPDGLIRRVRYQTTPRQMNGQPPHPDEERVRSLAGEVLAALGAPVPEGERELRFSVRAESGATDVYAPLSVRTIFVPGDWKTNYQEGRFFRDKVVVIGPTAPRFHDTHATPGGMISGPQLHLQAIGCALENAFVQTPSEAGRVRGLIAFAALVLTVAWAAWVVRPMLSALAAAGLVAGIVVAAFLTGAWFFWLLPIYVAVAIFVIGWGLAQSYDLVTEKLERGRLHREFRRFVSRDVADTLVRDPEVYRQVAIGRRRRVVVLFSDVRGFTSRSEDSDPEALVAQLNEYLSSMVAIVFRHGGTLDKFIGDAVMAHWGALEDGVESDFANQSVAAAQEMIAELAVLNERWRSEGREPFVVGIGLHLGEVLAGEIGSRERTEFGVIGDAVNLASRIEGMTKYFGVPLLVSGAVVDSLGEHQDLRAVGRIRVKGRHEAVELHAPSRGTERDGLFAAALELFKNGEFGRAAEAFLALHDLDPEDAAASRLAKWAADYEIERPESWDGVVIMENK